MIPQFVLMKSRTISGTETTPATRAHIQESVYMTIDTDIFHSRVNHEVFEKKTLRARKIPNDCYQDYILNLPNHYIHHSRQLRIV